MEPGMFNIIGCALMVPNLSKHCILARRLQKMCQRSGTWVQGHPGLSGWVSISTRLIIRILDTSILTNAPLHRYSYIISIDRDLSARLHGRVLSFQTGYNTSSFERNQNAPKTDSHSYRFIDHLRTDTRRLRVFRVKPIYYRHICGRDCASTEYTGSPIYANTIF